MLQGGYNSGGAFNQLHSLLGTDFILYRCIAQRSLVIIVWPLKHQIETAHIGKDGVSGQKLVKAADGGGASKDDGELLQPKMLQPEEFQDQNVGGSSPPAFPELQVFKRRPWQTGVKFFLHGGPVFWGERKSTDR